MYGNIHQNTKGLCPNVLFLEATGAIWSLAFDEVNQKRIIANSEAMNLLSLLRHSEVKKIAQNCEGTLWTMRELIKTKDKYKHLGMLYKYRNLGNWSFVAQITC